MANSAWFVFIDNKPWYHIVYHVAYTARCTMHHVSVSANPHVRVAEGQGMGNHASRSQSGWSQLGLGSHQEGGGLRMLWERCEKRRKSVMFPAPLLLFLLLLPPPDLSSMILLDLLHLLIPLFCCLRTAEKGPGSGPASFNVYY